MTVTNEMTRFKQIFAYKACWFRIGVGGLTFLSLAVTAIAQPMIAVSPKSGPPTARTTVSGTGFAANEAVDIYFDTADLALAATNGAGAFSGIRMTTPASAVPGAHWITGVGKTSGLTVQMKFTVQTNWPQFRGGPEHHGYNRTENILNASNVAGLQRLWYTECSTQFLESSPAVVNGVVYLGAGYGLCAVKADSGQLIWSISLPGAILSAPAVANGIVYFGSADGNVYAFDAATGHYVWSATTVNNINSSPAVVNGVVYIGSQDFNLHAYDAATGQQLWSALTGYYVNSSPAVANGVVYVGSLDNNLYAFTAANGQQLWSSPTGGAIWSSPAVANDVVYVGSFDNKLYAFNAATGQPVWTFTTSGVIECSPAVADGVVYVESEDNHLYALNAATGQSLWSVPTAQTVNTPVKRRSPEIATSSVSSPAVANGVVYVGSSSDGNLYAFNAATGQLLWTAVNGTFLYSSPTVADGKLYIGSYTTGYLYAFGLPGLQPPIRPNPATLKPALNLASGH